MTTREESLKTLYDLLETNDLEDLRISYDLCYRNHPTEKMAILHYGKLTKANKVSEMDSCRGLIIEAFPPYKVISHGFDRFLPRYENMNTIINLKKATVKEDGSLMFVFKYNDKFHLATMYDFADNTLAFSNKTYSDLFLQIINQPLDDFATNIINQFENKEQIMTLCFEICSLENRVIKAYETPTLFLTSVYGGENGLVEFDIPSDIKLCPNVELVTEIKFDSKIITFQDAYNKVLEYSKSDYTFEGFVLLTEDNKRIKVKNPYYYTHHILKYKGWLKATPQVIVPLIFDNIDEIIIQNVESAMPHDSIFVGRELRKRRDFYKNTVEKERENVCKLVNYIKSININNTQEFIDKLEKYSEEHNDGTFGKWKPFLFFLYKNNYDMHQFNNFCLKNLNSIFSESCHEFLSETHPNKSCKFTKGYTFDNNKNEQENRGLGKDPYTCFCGGKMKVTELRTEMVRYRYCHCGEPYGFLNYGSWTNIMICDNPDCTCTHEVNPYTRQPLGIPASTFCKSLRLEVHELMNSSGLSKSKAYKRIQEITNKTEEEAHMAKFGIDDCVRVLENF